MKTALASLGLALALSHAAFSQEKAAPLSFEVADVQVSKEMKPNPEGDFKNSRLAVFHITMKMLVMAAWDLKDDKMLTGAPSWFNTDQFDIVAKAKPDTPEATLKLMLQTLLAERFKLTYHREDKMVPVYALTVKKGGPKLTPAAQGGKTECPTVSLNDGQIHRACTNITMADFATALPTMAPAYMDLPVVNMTDLKGAFDFQLTWVGRGRIMAAGDRTSPGGDSAGLTIFEAVDKQLGLKLESTKHSMPVLAIDHIERIPTGN